MCGIKVAGHVSKEFSKNFIVNLTLVYQLKQQQTKVLNSDDAVLYNSNIGSGQNIFSDRLKKLCFYEDLKRKGNL